jgi:hypothetical protein
MLPTLRAEWSECCQEFSRAFKLLYRPTSYSYFCPGLFTARAELS